MLCSVHKTPTPVIPRLHAQHYSVQYTLDSRHRETAMYHPSTSSSSSCYGSNGGPFILSQPDAFLPSSSLPSPSSYGLLQEHFFQPHLLPPPAGAQARANSQSSGAAFRRVQSTGDLVGVGAPAGRYSAEERRERIEKYRSKRNQRNFQKKITYACRKTLADSRPRVKGRFARNDGADAESEFTTTEVSSLMNEGGGHADVATDASSSMPEWWPAMQGALAMEDEELLASYLGVSSINLY